MNSPATPPIQTIYFDLGNVLLHFDHELACENLGRIFEVPPDQVRAAVFDSGLEIRYEQGELTTEEFYEDLCLRWGRRPPLAAVRQAAADIFWVNHATVAVAAQLKAAGYVTGILSNTCEAHWQYVMDGRYRFLNEFFDLVVLSYEVKSMKPHPPIYEAAVELAGVSAAEIFFMDDRLENVAGAIEAGITAVHFAHGHQLANDLQRHGVRFNY